ncbi:hypothetical protein GIB67_024451 [Kingdonia uniflora]|uniref:F-actin-capping protein subunit alpha n=1 Tax=Kingdonia uniflora TaxID=39325 RepID=A0A7J7P4Q8_9MAGN|nr:hypothetical protein GIB67_024451 [Kingdonia uniflora]
MLVIDFPPMTTTAQPFKVYSRRPRAHPAPVRSTLGNTPSDLPVTVSNDILVTVDIPVSDDIFPVVPLVLITTFGEFSDTEYLDPRTAQVATIDHVKQVCTKVRPSADEELPSLYIEEFRYVYVVITMFNYCI